MSLFYRTDSEWTRDAHFKLQVRSREVISYEGWDNIHLVHWSVRAGLNVVHAMYIWGDFQDEDLI